MRYNPINEKYKIILHTPSLTQEQVSVFFNILKVLKTFTVKYFNPYTGEYRTATCYRGDRSITMKWDRKDVGILYEPFDISLIEL